MVDMLTQDSLPVRPTDRWVRLYSILLQLYPATFRNAYSIEMVIMFRDCLRDARNEGTRGILQLWLHIFIDIGLSVPRVYLEEWNMQASYTRSNQIGAVTAVICAVVLVGTLAGFFNMDTPGVATGGLLIALYGVGWFGMLFSLYRRIEVVQSTSENKASLGVGGFALVLILAASALYTVNHGYAGAFASLGLLIGLVALALFGINSFRLPELGQWRIAPLLAILPVVLFAVTWAGVWNKAIAATGVVSAILALIGTGVLLWTSAK